MINEKRTLLNKIDLLICKRKSELLKVIPSVHDITDGIDINFFSELDDVVYKRIINDDYPNEINFFLYLPKGSYFELVRKEYVSTITCLSGNVEFDLNGKYRDVKPYSKILINSEVLQAKAVENSYILTSSSN